MNMNHLKKEDQIQTETLNRIQKDPKTKVLIPKPSFLFLIEDKNEKPEKKSNVEEPPTENPPKKPKEESREKKNKKLDPNQTHSLDTQPKKHKTDKKLNEEEPEIEDEIGFIKLFSVPIF